MVFTLSTIGVTHIYGVLKINMELNPGRVGRIAFLDRKTENMCRLEVDVRVGMLGNMGVKKTNEQAQEI